MAGKDAIQFLRGNSSRKAAVGNSTTLLAGQPFFETDTNKLYIGDGTKNLNALSAVGGSNYYSTVISNQSEFESWYKELDAGTYTGESVLILSGEYTRSDGKGLHLPNTLKQLHGLGNVRISIINFVFILNSNYAGIWYTTPITSDTYSIENIYLSCSSTNDSDVHGFHNCTNLINCTGVGASSNEVYQGSGSCGYGFSSCTNLTNCTGTGISLSHIGYGFYECVNLTNCNGTSNVRGSYVAGYAFYGCTSITNCTGTANAVGYHASAWGFSSCTSITNCTGTAIGSEPYSNGYGFSSCTGLTNCTGSGTASDVAYGFYNCKMCSNCQKDPQNTRTAWRGNNTNISKDTCPEYTG